MCPKCVFIDLDLTLIGGMQVLNDIRLCLLLLPLLPLHTRQSGGSVLKLHQKGVNCGLLVSDSAL